MDPHAMDPYAVQHSAVILQMCRNGIAILVVRNSWCRIHVQLGIVQQLCRCKIADIVSASVPTETVTAPESLVLSRTLEL